MTSFRLIPEPAGATVWSQVRAIATRLEMANKRKLDTAEICIAAIKNPKTRIYSLDNKANHIPINPVAISMP